PNYLLLKNKPATILLQTMLSPYRDIQVPPLTSSLVPRKPFTRIAVWYEWNKYFLESAITRSTHFGDTLSGVTNRLAKRRGIDLKNKVTYDKAFHVGLKNVQEIILAPRVFDFPRRELKSNQVYAGLCSDPGRIDIHVDLDYEEYIESLPGNSEIIYCSLGTLANIHFNGVFWFYNKLIDAFRFRSEILILSIGSFDKCSIKNIPANVRIFHWVPQISLLGRCRIMITHGGLNSILESIMCGKPLLVFPLTKTWDQNGNAARVIYHGVGLRGNIKRTSSERMNKQITELLKNNYYKSNVERLRFAFSENMIDKKILEKVLTMATEISHEDEQMD
ncbi:MAG: hypothetical protein C0490_19755, partial [Marivirga sp.]|nr:hypothetical protein [Marivirga sp.]